MNKEAVKKWRDALRSGEYKQGSMRLRSKDDSYCCLGVFTEAVANMKPDCLVNDEYLYNVDSIFLPEKAMKVMGTENHGPKIFGLPFHGLNDSGFGAVDPLTFDEIADLLDIALIEGEGIE